jgi:hypothetical protein
MSPQRKSIGVGGRGVRLMLVVFVVSLAWLVCVSSSLAASPWWHLTSSSRPGYLPVGAGTGTSEVQEIVTTSTVVGGEPVTFLGVEIEGSGEVFTLLKFDGEELEFASEPWLKNHPSPFFVALTTANLQKALEESGYGPVTVTETEEEPAVGEFVKHFALKSHGFAPAPQLKVFGSPPPKVKVVTAASFQGSHITVTAANLGDAPTSGETTIVDTLPAGVEALVAEGISGLSFTSNGTPLTCSVESPHTVKCTSTAPLPPYALIEVNIGVAVGKGASTGEENEVSVSGGGAPSVPPLARPITVSEQPTPFGVQDYELTAEEEGGGVDSQAGSHPFQVTGTLTLEQTAAGEPAQLPKDLIGELPPGLIGNPTVFTKCTISQFFNQTCVPQSVLGVAMITIKEPTLFASGNHIGTFTLPIVNLEPSGGEAARFGFLLPGIAPVFLDATVRTGGDYGVTLGSTDISQIAGFLGFHLTFWGVPGDPRHQLSRGGGPLEESEAPPFLAMPTSCTTPLKTSIVGDSWAQAGTFHEYQGEPIAPLDGCNRLLFSPEITVTPDGTAASSPSGLKVDVHVPQTSILSAKGLAESAVKNVTVALPEGVMINPSGGDGLQACSEGLVGFTGFTKYEPGSETATFTSKLPERLEPGLNFCASASKIATVNISSPLLPATQHLEGAVYLATQNENPFGSLIAMYIVAEDPVSKTLVKLPGETRLTGSGQIITTFKNTPELAFEDAELHFFGGERAPLSTPAHCGAYTTNALFTPWAAEPSDEAQADVSSSSTFNITSGPNGSACPGSSLPFSPSFTGGTTNINAGSFSSLVTTIGREDGNQNLQSVQLHMPLGLSGILTGVKLCGEQQANEGTCGPESEIGETTVSAGVGSDPVTVKGGKVYITEAYAGAPFGLSIVNPVKAGPFDLEHDTSPSDPGYTPACDCVVVRAKIEVNPSTAQLTVTTDSSGAHAIPHIIDGIPAQIKHVNVTINRPNFIFNPTNCAPASITGTITSDEGASEALTEPFQATNCKDLKFAPKFTVATSGKTSKADGASLTVKLAYPAPFTNYANIAKVKVDLPKQLPSRLTTLQKACLAAVFEANPANCPAASIVGHAKAITPLLPVPLEGNAYFVSHGNEAFPSLTMVLKGYGVTIDLVGSTFIKKGITSSTFKAVPDQPVTSFELTLPEGKYSALAANANLCKSKLAMPTAFVAQNGAEIHETTKIGVTGCPKAKKAAKKKTKRK